MIAVIGPTGVGKSAAALEAAAATGSQIVAADAFTVYRGMDIGTAKPSAADRERVTHHLIDVLDPGDDCTVSWFQKTGRAVIGRLRALGTMPLLVGGSGLYLRALVDGLQFPPTDAGVRDRIAEQYAADPAAGHRALAEQDPSAAAKIEPGNLRRTVRALEVAELTGQLFSSFRTDWDSYDSIYQPLHLLAVTMPRDALRARIDRRVDAMMANGWLEEAAELRRRGALSATARQAIGYAELWSHLDGERSLADAVDRIKIRTRQYAVRQERWFSADPRVQWVAPQEVVPKVEELRG